MNFRFPVFLDLTGKNCLVTGQGYEVAGKVRALADAGANVSYVNPEAEPAIVALADEGRIVWKKRDFDPLDLEGCFLVISDLDDNSAVFAQAEEKRVLCNAVDDPPHCRFSFGSLHRQGDLTIAISTNGWAPAMAVRLKERFQREVGPEYGAMLRLLAKVRPEIGERIADFEARRDLWYRIVDSAVLELLREQQDEAAERTIYELIDAASSTSRSHTSGDNAHP